MSERPSCKDCGKKTYSLYLVSVRGGSRLISVAGPRTRRPRCEGCAVKAVERLNEKERIMSLTETNARRTARSNAIVTGLLAQNNGSIKLALFDAEAGYEAKSESYRTVAAERHPGHFLVEGAAFECNTYQDAVLKLRSMASA